MWSRVSVYQKLVVCVQAPTPRSGTAAAGPSPSLGVATSRVMTRISSPEGEGFRDKRSQEIIAQSVELHLLSPSSARGGGRQRDVMQPAKWIGEAKRLWGPKLAKLEYKEAGPTDLRAQHAAPSTARPACGVAVMSSRVYEVRHSGVGKATKPGRLHSPTC